MKASYQFDILPEDIQQKALAALEVHSMVTVTKEDLQNKMGQVWGWGYHIKAGVEWPYETKGIDWEPVNSLSIEITWARGDHLILRRISQ